MTLFILQYNIVFGPSADYFLDFKGISFNTISPIIYQPQVLNHYIVLSFV